MAERHKTAHNGWFSNLFRAGSESASSPSVLPPIAESYFNATADALIVVNQIDGLVLKVNPAAEKLLHYVSGTLTGVHFSNLLPPTTANQHTSLLHRFRDMTGITEGQAFRRSDGSEVPCDISLTLVQEGQRAVAVLNLRDASERETRTSKQQNAVRLHAETEANKESARQKDQFISRLAHQLRTPMAVIHSSAGMVLRYYDRLPVEKRVEHLIRIQTHSRLAATFIEDLRFLNTIETGEVKLHVEYHDLFDLTQRAIKPYHDHINQPKIVFITENEINQPVTMDEQIYRMLVDKLVSNAVLYSPQASPLHITLSQQDGGSTLTIRDHGIGIPSEFLPRAFEPYQRGGNIGEVDGMGLGLTVAQACAVLMGYDLTLDSILGRGTTVKIGLPSSP